MVLRVVGKALIAAGLSILLFLGYQLFGTNFITDHNQKTLAVGLEKKWAAHPVAPTVESPPDLGDGVAIIRIPKIDVDRVVVEGTALDDLKKGPGHYRNTAFPGQKGNVVISGHRTTYGAPFYRLDELRAGDVIRLVTAGDTYSYKVTESKVVEPTDLSVITQADDYRLTLTTCNPRFSARQRLIIVAELVERPDRALQKGAA
jgi:sortase A